jgi:uncharacterized membrane protein YgcG
MNIQRIVRHLLTTDGQVSRSFGPGILTKIEAAIQASEAEHAGEIRFVVEGGLDGAPLFKGQSARERAIDLFSHLRLWDTEQRTGVLIYLLLADRAVEIVADRGINAQVDSQEWATVCRQMEAAFRQSNFESGVVAGVQAVTRQLKAHFPLGIRDRNELPDKPVVL